MPSDSDDKVDTLLRIVDALFKIQIVCPFVTFRLRQRIGCDHDFLNFVKYTESEDSSNHRSMMPSWTVCLVPSVFPCAHALYNTVNTHAVIPGVETLCITHVQQCAVSCLLTHSTMVSSKEARLK